MLISGTVMLNTGNTRTTQIVGNANVGAIKLNNDCQLLTVNYSGTGDLEHHGTGEEATLNNAGVADIHVGTFKNVEIFSTGAGDISLTATARVAGRLSGCGDLTVRGNAYVDVACDGAGEVSRKNINPPSIDF